MLKPQESLRGAQVLVPAGWTMDGSDGGGSGSTSTWADPSNPKQWIVASDGMELGSWLATDGVDGSVDPTQMIPDGADVARESRTVYRYSYRDPKSGASVLGAWIAGVDGRGYGLGYEQVEVSLSNDQANIATSIVDAFVERARAGFAAGSAGSQSEGLPSSGPVRADGEIAATWDEYFAYFCPRGPAGMPHLTDSSADKYATSIIQMSLAARGYDVGPIDGQYGSRTERAVRAFQRDMGLTVDGLVGDQTWTATYTDCESEGGAPSDSPTGSNARGADGGDTTFLLNILLPDVECGFQGATTTVNDLTAGGEVRFYDGQMNLLYVKRLGECFIPGYQGAPQMSERAKGAWSLSATVPPSPDGVYQVVIGTKGRNPVSYNASDAVNGVISANIRVR